MARYSLGPPLRSGLPPFGRHHFAALMRRNLNCMRQNEMHPEQESKLIVSIIQKREK